VRRVPSAKAVRFTAVLQPTDHGAFVELPADAVEGLGARGRTSVTGSLDGHEVTGQVMPYMFGAEGRKVVLGVTKAIRAKLGKAIGATVSVELARDDAPRIVSVPDELRAALDRDPKAAATWNGLAPSHRNEHAAWVGSARRPATREQRAQRTIERLTTGG
jgi:hypothetical protein